MTEYSLIKGDEVISTIDLSDKDLLAVPLLNGEDGMSLISERHIKNLMDRLKLTKAEVLEMMGITDKRTTEVT